MPTLLSSCLAVFTFKLFNNIFLFGNAQIMKGTLAWEYEDKCDVGNDLEVFCHVFFFEDGTRMPAFYWKG
jgi:homoserine trans-succinylase